jgi:hypothetical protein
LISATQAEPITETFAAASEIEKSVDKFREWLEASDGVSYDPYDLAGTRYGQWARRLYYRKHPLGAVFSAPLVATEILCPSIRAVLVGKDRYPTADAQLALAFLNLYELRRGESKSGAPDRNDEGHSSNPYLAKAQDLAAGLLEQSIPGYSGFCWGYPFDWRHVNGLMPKGTPHITATPYCYETFTRLFDLTGDEYNLEVARSIASFVFHNLNDTPMGEGAAAASYTPTDQTKVVNASAYRAFVLFDAARRFDEPSYREKALKNLRFILQSQQADGSWLYAIDNPPEAFIDHFHTCFVLKNLFKINQCLQSGEVDRAIKNGYAFYRKALFDADDNPKSYAVAPRIQIVRLEMYNVAEAISLGTLLRNEIPEAFELAKKLAERHARRDQLSDGHWVTRVYTGGIKHTVAFLRWPQAQLFLAMTNLLLATSCRKNSAS